VVIKKSLVIASESIQRVFYVIYEELNLSNIEELILKISEKTGLSRGQIKQKIEEKKEELGFFVNDIAAAHIIAKDLDVALGQSKFKKPKLTIKSLKSMEPGLPGIELTGVVYRIYHPIEFTKGEGKNILVPLLLHDGTDSIRLLLWGNQARLITENRIQRGSVIRIKQAYTKIGRTQELELHIGDKGLVEIEKDSETEYPDPENDIMQLDVIDEEMQEIDIQATVVSVGNIVTFNRTDGSEGRVTNLLLKGERVTRRMVFWDKRVDEAFNFTRGDILLIQAANVKMDRDGNPELHASGATYTKKIGHKTMLSIEEKRADVSTSQEIVERKIKDLQTSDNLVSVIVRKGPVGKVSSFTRKDGTDGAVQRAVIFDETGEITLVLWNNSIDAYDGLEDNAFKAYPLRVNVSRYKTLELHSTFGTEFTPLESSKISEDPPIQDIQDISPKQGLISIQGVIQEISETREFIRNDGNKGRVCSLTIADNTGATRIVAWGDNVDKIHDIQEKEMKYVKIFFGGVRQRDTDELEVHLTSQSHIRPSSRVPEALRDISTIEKSSSVSKPQVEYKKIRLSELNETEDDKLIEVVGKMTRIFQQTPYYYACPECRKKVDELETGWICAEHGIVEPDIRFRLSGVIDDGTGTIRTTFFGLSGEILTGMSGKDIKALIKNGLSDDEIFTSVQQEAEGKTVLIQGRVQLQTREVQGETMQSQTLFANRVRMPHAKTIAEDLIAELEES